MNAHLEQGFRKDNHAKRGKRIGCSGQIDNPCLIHIKPAKTTAARKEWIIAT